MSGRRLRPISPEAMRSIQRLKLTGAAILVSDTTGIGESEERCPLTARWKGWDEWAFFSRGRSPPGVSSAGMADVTQILSAIERGDPMPRQNCSRSSTTSCGSWRRATGRGEAGPDPPADRPGPRGLRPSRRPGGRTRSGTAGATSSPLPPRPCAASSSSPPAKSRRSREAAGAAGRPRRRASSPPRSDPEDILALDEALGRLAQTEPRAAELVKLRYLRRAHDPPGRRRARGLPPDGRRLWAYARAWLLRQSSEGSPSESPEKKIPPDCGGAGAGPRIDR